MTDVMPAGALPAAPFIRIRSDGVPQLSFLRCGYCGAFAMEAERLACARCGKRDGFEQRVVGNAGKLHSYSIVHRGFPGTAVPFISAVVDLDDGPSIKGNLRGLPFDPAFVPLGMRVKVVFDDALGRQDTAGNSYISHFFEPDTAGASA